MTTRCWSRSKRLGKRFCLLGLILVLSLGCSVTETPTPPSAATDQEPDRLEWQEWQEWRYGYTVRYPGEWRVAGSFRGDVQWIVPAGDGTDVRYPGIRIYAYDEEPTSDPWPISKESLLKSEGGWPVSLAKVTEVEEIQVPTANGPAPGFLLHGEGEVDGHPYQGVKLLLPGSGHSIHLICTAPVKEWQRWEPVCLEVVRTFVAGDLTWGDLSHRRPPMWMIEEYAEWVEPRHGYRLRYPEGWAVADSFGETMLWLTPYGFEISADLPSIALFVTDFPSPLQSADATPGALLQSGKDSSYVGSIRTVEETTVETSRGPVPGLRLRGSSVKLEGIQLSVAGRGHAIDLVCMAPESEWDRWQPMCEEVISTFRAGDLDVAHPDPRAPYQPLWQIPIAGDRILEVYLAANGDRAAVQTLDDVVQVFGRDGTAVEISVWGHVTPMPDLSVWLMKSILFDGKLEARGLDGKVIWQAPAPAGDLYVSPDGSLILISWDGFETEQPRTAAYSPDGRQLWHTTQFGGDVSFTDRGDFLVWDQQGFSWYLVSPAGEVLRSGHSVSSISISRDGQLLLSGNGRIQTLDSQDLFHGPGALFASDRRNLHLFLTKPLGGQVMAYDTGGRLLWSRDRELRAPSVSPSGTFVFGWHLQGLWIWDGMTGQDLDYLPGVRKVALSSNGNHLVVLYPDRLAFMARSQQAGRLTRGSAADWDTAP